MQSILVVGIIIIVGFLFGEIATKIKLPKVTGYILAGVLLNPNLSHLIPSDFTNNTDIVVNISLAFITFSVGGTLLYSRIKRLGKSIISITLFEAEFAFIVVAIGFLAIAPIFMNFNNATWLTVFIPVSLLIASLASPTDPSATLAVVHEYKAKGEVSSTIMGVAAFDDALGIINYSFAVVVSSALIMHQKFGINAFILKPVLIICGSAALGVVFGVIFNKISEFIRKESEGVLIVLILGILSICFGVAQLLGADELFTTMIMGVVVVNFNRNREKIFNVLERYTEELIFVLFFTISGMHLNFSVLANSLWLVVLFSIFRALGKILGTVTGAAIAKSHPNVKRFTAGGLIPQGGIVVGLALLMKQNLAFAHIADSIISIIIGATVIHELIGPIIAKISLEKAGELKKV